MYIDGYENAVKLGVAVNGPAGTIRKPTLLKRKGNRLIYTVNIRDLRDAAIVEIDSYNQGH